MPAQDDCPVCKTPMERGITEWGQVCPACLYQADDGYWSMAGEHIDEDGKPTLNPRASIMRLDALRHWEPVPASELPDEVRHYANHSWDGEWTEFRIEGVLYAVALTEPC